MLELREPLRSTLLLRFFEGMSAAAIARGAVAAFSLEGLVSTEDFYPRSWT